jgi:hypothetical protein
MKSIQILVLCCLTFGSEFVYAGCSSPPFYIQPDKPSPINMGDSIRLNFVVSGTTCPTASNYQWYKDDSLILDATNNFYIAKYTGVYKIKFLADGQLDSLFFEVVVNPVGISDIAKTAVKIFPNPTSGVINIEHLEQYIGGTLEISDVMGRKITTQEITQSNITYHFDNQPKGIFIVRIMNNGAAIIRKILYQ